MSEGARHEHCDQCSQLDHTKAIAIAALEFYPMEAVVIVTAQSDEDSWNVEAVVMGQSPTQLMFTMAMALRKVAESLEEAARKHDAQNRQAPS